MMINEWVAYEIVIALELTITMLRLLKNRTVKN